MISAAPDRPIVILDAPPSREISRTPSGVTGCGEMEAGRSHADCPANGYSSRRRACGPLDVDIVRLPTLEVRRELRAPIRYFQGALSPCRKHMDSITSPQSEPVTDFGHVISKKTDQSVG
ncbi:hypothetical protein IFM12275_67190 [Nocardia sputorum]|nr:hypothetical protein IFM12275_67190 [Nocardia sputorum]